MGIINGSTHLRSGQLSSESPDIPGNSLAPPFFNAQVDPLEVHAKVAKKSQRHGHQKSGIEKRRVGRLASLSLSSPPGHDPICACAAKALDPFIIPMGGIKKLCTTCIFRFHCKCVRSIRTLMGTCWRELRCHVRWTHDTKTKAGIGRRLANRLFIRQNICGGVSGKPRLDLMAKTNPCTRFSVQIVGYLNAQFQGSQRMGWGERIAKAPCVWAGGGRRGWAQDLGHVQPGRFLYIGCGGPCNPMCNPMFSKENL